MSVAIIPARGGSKAIPKKNILPFLGRPLIEYTVDHALSSDTIDATYVSTDDEYIAEVSRGAGASVVDRPDELAGDRSTTEEALLHALDTIPESPDVVTLLQCTSPLRRYHDIDEAVALVSDGSYDSALSCCADHSFYWTVEDEEAVPANYDPKSRQMRQETEQRYKENGSIYVTDRGLLEREECRLGGSIGIHEMPVELSFEIDTPEDYRIVESIARTREFDSGFVVD